MEAASTAAANASGGGVAGGVAAAAAAAVPPSKGSKRAAETTHLSRESELLQPEPGASMGPPILTRSGRCIRTSSAYSDYV